MKNNDCIIIIGASSGLGKECAREFYSRGHQVAVVARRGQILQQLSATLGNCPWLELDVTAEDAPEKLIDFAGKCNARTFLYCAGCGFLNPGLDVSKDRATVELNVGAFTVMMDTIFTYLRENGGTGHIAAISSVASTKGIGVAASYSASKRYQREYLLALSQLSRIQHTKIRITDIRPGFVDTPLLDSGEHKYPMLMEVKHAVPLIVRAVEKGKSTVTVDWRWRCLTAMWRRIPNWLWRRLPITQN